MAEVANVKPNTAHLAILLDKFMKSPLVAVRYCTFGNLPVHDRKSQVIIKIELLSAEIHYPVGLSPGFGDPASAVRQTGAISGGGV
jgi:hypothetical protein